jgi:RHS repeat-associated protein
MNRHSQVVPRFRVAVLALVMTATSFIVQAAPVPQRIPLVPDSAPIPFALGPQTAKAAYCATPNPSFQGFLTQTVQEPGVPPMVNRITSGNVYGYISNVVTAWACTLYMRYDGLMWVENGGSQGTFDWGTIINSTSNPCNWVTGGDNYLKANNTTSCPSADDHAVLTSTLERDAPGTAMEGIFQSDANHDSMGDFAFVHSDCDTTPYYGHEVMKWNATLIETNTPNRPGANCDALTYDSTNTAQTVIYDKTAPTVAFAQPATGTGPTVIPSAFYTPQFDATDAVAGFGGANGWSLQRQVGTGSTCAGFANDGTAVTGTTNAAGQLSGQSLSMGKCYQWLLGATDQNGNVAATITSGSIRTDTSGVLGLQGQLKTEGWDLGAGDSLAVSPGSGNLVINHPIVSLPIRGSATSVDLTYNSQDSSNVGFGPGWRLNVQRRLVIDAGTGDVTFTDSDGSRHTFTSPVTVGTVTTYARPATLYATLVKDTSISANEFVLTYGDVSEDKFDILGSEGILVRAEDRFANGVTLAYFAATNRISTITDTAGGRTIDFAYDGSNRLTSITDWAYVSSGVVQTSATGSRRATRFFYDGSSNLSGWADGLNTAGSCPSSHATCLTLSAAPLYLVNAIGKTQTYETLSAGALGSTARTISTAITYAGSDVTAVKNAEEVAAGSAGTAFSHPAAGQTQVVRRGSGSASQDTTTTYTLASVTEAYGRISSVKRKFGGAQIEQRTTYDTTYPIEPASITDNYVNGTVGDGSNPTVDDRTTSWTYVASSLGLVSRMTEPLDASTHRTTDYTYNTNNDVTQKIVALDGSGTTRTIARYCYDASCTTSGAATLTMSKQIDNYVDGTAGNGAANVEDVTTSFIDDAYGQRTRATRSNYNAAGTLLDSAATGHTYDSAGNLTSDIANYVNGAVSTGTPDDITPNATTNARTDLTTAYTYDTAGNQVGSADPRRAIETALVSCLYQDDYVGHQAFDAVGAAVSTREPTTPNASCPTVPGPTTTSAYDELGDVLASTDPGGVVSATEANRLGQGTRLFEDTDDTGGAAAAVTTSTTYDPSGRVLTAKDRLQSTAGSTLGATSSTYDELGRSTETTDGYLSSPDVASITHRAFDALDRQTAEISGFGGATAQTTTTGYDLGGRAVSIDDEFTCTSATYDYRDLAISEVDGLNSGTCSGGTPVTTAITSDGLGRVTLRSVDANNAPESNTYEAAGNILASSGKQGGTTTTSTYTLNPADQVVIEIRTDGSTSKANYDAAGNVTDRCYWKPSITVGACLPADTASWTNPPTQVGTTKSDARNQKVTLISRLGSTSTVATTTYDPAQNYQISAFYLPTHYNGSGQRDAEAQDLYHYDNRHRLDEIKHQRCSVTAGTDTCTGTVLDSGYTAYGYDDNDNRTTVTESSTAGLGSATTRSYCHDALNRLTASKATTACTSTPDETNVYDDAGNRTSATASGSTRTFTYDAEGQVSSCATPSCSVTYDASGRSATITDNGVAWTFAYDADGRIIGACKSIACSGSIDRVDYLYDGSGHRIQVKETTSAGVVTTTDLRYQGDTVVQELVGGTVSRTYATDDTGRIVEVCDPDCATGTIYVVVYNGHGDATGLWKQEASGVLTLANSYTYSTWGTPTTTVNTGGGFSDLKFRFLYVGAADVQWDSSFSLNLFYMHARHYSPALARFVQPDPSGAEANLYAYGDDSPVTKSDCSGLWTEPGSLPDKKCLDLRSLMIELAQHIMYKVEQIYLDKRFLPWYTHVEGMPGTIEGHQRKIGEWSKTLQSDIGKWDRGDCGGPGRGGKLPRWVREVAYSREVPVPKTGRTQPPPGQNYNFWRNLWNINVDLRSVARNTAIGLGGAGVFMLIVLAGRQKTL